MSITRNGVRETVRPAPPDPTPSVIKRARARLNGESRPAGGPLPGSVRRRRTRTLVLAATLLVLLPAAGAAFFANRQPATYAAEAELVYRGVDTGSTDVIGRELETQQLLLTGAPAVEVAARAVRQSPADLAKRVSTQVVKASNLVRLRVQDHSASVARQVASSLVTQYTQTLQKKVADRIAQHNQPIDAQLHTLNTRLAAITDRLRVIGSSDINVPNALQSEQTSLQSEQTAVRQQIAELQTQEIAWTTTNPTAGLATVDVVSPATVLPRPVGPQPLRAAAAGALVGLLLAFLLVAFARRRQAPGETEGAARS